MWQVSQGVTACAPVSGNLVRRWSKLLLPGCWAAEGTACVRAAIAMTPTNTGRTRRAMRVMFMATLLSAERAPGVSGLDGLERTGDVAALAKPPETAVVNVGIFVAARAGGGDDRASANRELVAGVAIEAHVLAIEDE